MERNRSNTVYGQTITPAVTVNIADQFGNPTGSGNSNITVAIGSNPASGTLSGTLTVAASSGTATFSDLSLIYAGSGYTLTAASTGLTGGTSSSFGIVTIAQRGSATTATTIATTLTLNKPTGVLAGDVMIVNIEAKGNAISPSLSGWTGIAYGPIESGVASAHCAVLYKVADSSDTGVSSYAFNLGTGANGAAGAIVAFSGVDATGGFLVGGGSGGPFDVAPGVWTTNTAGSSSISNVTAITTASTNAAVIMFVGAFNSSSSVSGFSTASPGSLAALYSSAQGNGTVGAGWGTKATSGTTGTGSATLGSSQRWGAILLALKPRSAANTVSSSANPSKYGQASVTFTATLTGTGSTPTGTLQFKTNGVNFGGAVTVSSGGATSGGLLTTLPPGSYTVTADYSGDGNYPGNRATLPGGQAVQKSDTTTAVTSPVADPSVYGQSGVTFHAVVSAASPGSGTPTGTVQFKTNGVNFGSALNLSGGAADSGILTTLPTGSYSVTAVYSSDANFNASTSGTLAQAINKAGTSASVSSSLNPSPTTSNVTFTAVLTAVSPSGGTVTGAVQFLADGTPLGSPVALAGGIASLSTNSLSHGRHTITVQYAGDANFFGSTNSLSPNELVDNAPVAASDTLQRYPATGAKGRVTALLANDSDPDGDSVSFSSVHAASAQGGTVVTNFGWVFYTPPTGFTNTDSFSYVITAGSLQATGAVAVAIVADTNFSQNIGFSRDLGNGSHLASFFGIPGRTYTIQYTTNQASPTWQALGTATADAGGLFQFIDFPGSNAPSRIYRSTYP